MKRVKVGGNRFAPVLPPGSRYVGRPAPYLEGSRIANPFKVKDHGRDEALRLYRRWLAERPALIEWARRELSGYDLACWCHLDQPCHVDIIIAFISQPAPQGA